MIAIFDTESKAAICLEMVHAYLIVNREGYNAERWSAHNKSDNTERWAVSLPPEPVDVVGAIEFVEKYPDGWRKIELPKITP